MWVVSGVQGSERLCSAAQGTPGRRAGAHLWCPEMPPHFPSSPLLRGWTLGREKASGETWNLQAQLHVGGEASEASLAGDGDNHWECWGKADSGSLSEILVSLDCMWPRNAHFYKWSR